MRRFVSLVIVAILVFIISEDGGTFAAPSDCKPNGHWVCPSPTPTPTPPPGVSWSMHPNFVGSDGSLFEVPPFYNGRMADPSTCFGVCIRGDLGGIVEQQSGGASQPDSSLWVINPPALLGAVPWCVWDADDRVRGDFVGTLAPSQAISITLCMITDTMPHRAGLSLVDYPQLVGSITFGEYTTMSVTGGRSGCIVGAQYKDLSDSRLSLIANTNFPAAGRYQNVTFSVTNPTTSAVSITVPMTLGRYQDGAPDFPESRWCPGDNFPSSLIWQYGNWLYPSEDVASGAQPGVWWVN